MMNKRLLYTGLDPSRYGEEVIHCPLIEIVPRSREEVSTYFETFSRYTHCLFTSRVAATLFFERCDQLDTQMCITVGRATGELLEERGLVPLIAYPETAEGVVGLLEKLDLQKAHLFFPSSSGSRRVIPEYLTERGVLFTQCFLYDTTPRSITELPPHDALIFTSPSTVDAYIKNFGHLPDNKELIALGPVTEKRLLRYGKAIQTTDHSN